MRRIIMVLTMAALVGAMLATSGASASAQSPCLPTAPSGGPATLISADESLGAGFVCLDEEAQEFFCPPKYELQLFPILPGESPGPTFISECAETSSASDGGETGGSGGGSVDLIQEGDQDADAGQIEQTYDVG